MNCAEMQVLHRMPLYGKLQLASFAMPGETGTNRSGAAMGIGGDAAVYFGALETGRLFAFSGQGLCHRFIPSEHILLVDICCRTMPQALLRCPPSASSSSLQAGMVLP